MFEVVKNHSIFQFSVHSFSCQTGGSHAQISINCTAFRRRSFCFICIWKGEVTTLVPTGHMVGGRRLSFVNDLDVTQDGRKVYFTDSSSKWQRRDYLYLIMEATADGR